MSASLPFAGSPISKMGEFAALVAATGAVIRVGSEHPMYDPKTDEIHLPNYPAGTPPVNIAADLAHELIHWTRHSSRLGRDLGMIVWCDPGCAHEEVVAELGAVFLCSGLGVTLASRAEYITGWLYWAQDRITPLLSAARYAALAADYLRSN